MRVLAEQNGISLDEMTERAKKDPQYDIEANRMQVMR